MIVRLANLNNLNNLNCTIDTAANYGDVLRERLRRLERWVGANTLSQARSLIVEAAAEMGWSKDLDITEEDLNKILFGERGMITSCLLSLNGENPYKSPEGSTRLSKVEGNNPYLVDEKGARFVRGAIVGGMYPYKNPTNNYTLVRNLIELRLDLPRYIRHQLVAGDETL